MNTHYLTTVRRLFNNPLAPESTNRHNQRAWVKSVRLLGDKWLLKRATIRL
jgi:hypothetical protein